MLKKVKGSKTMKIFLIILFGIFIYFGSQKIIVKRYDNGNISLYEFIATKLYLGVKYPFNSFKILYVEEESRGSFFDSGGGGQGILLSKSICVQNRIDKEDIFQVEIKYILNPLDLIIGSFYEKYNAFSIGVLLNDNSEFERDKNRLTIKLENEISKNVIEKYFSKDTFDLKLDIHNFKKGFETSEEFIRFFNTTSEPLFLYLDIYVDEGLELSNYEKIKRYYEMSKKIVKDLELYLNTKLENDEDWFNFQIQVNFIDKENPKNIFGSYRLIKDNENKDDNKYYDEATEGFELLHNNKMIFEKELYNKIYKDLRENYLKYEKFELENIYNLEVEIETEPLTIFSPDKIKTIKDAIKDANNYNKKFDVLVRIHLNEDKSANYNNKLRKYYEISKKIARNLKIYLDSKEKLGKFSIKILAYSDYPDFFGKYEITDSKEAAYDDFEKIYEEEQIKIQIQRYKGES